MNSNNKLINFPVNFLPNNTAMHFTKFNNHFSKILTKSRKCIGNPSNCFQLVLCSRGLRQIGASTLYAENELLLVCQLSSLLLSLSDSVLSNSEEYTLDERCSGGGADLLRLILRIPLLMMTVR